MYYTYLNMYLIGDTLTPEPFSPCKPILHYKPPADSQRDPMPSNDCAVITDSGPTLSALGGNRTELGGW